jgi:L-amino acid N-acyltransferase YncA
MIDSNIRPAEPGDIPAITRIYAEAVEHGTATFELMPPDEAEMTRRQSALVGNGFPYFVAVRDGELAGYAYAGPYHTRAGYRWTVEDTVYVDPQFHRQGLGRLLVARVVAEAEVRGFRQMLAVIAGSGHVSTALHAACGFRQVGTLQSVGWKHGRWIDVVLMQRALGQADATAP